jgi:hypothetical protein
VVGVESGRVPVPTVDVRRLNSLSWGPVRAMFPSFVEEIELGRYLKRVLTDTPCKAVQVKPHQDAAGLPSTHVFDVFFMNELGQEG